MIFFCVDWYDHVNMCFFSNVQGFYLLLAGAAGAVHLLDFMEQ